MHRGVPVGSSRAFARWGALLAVLGVGFGPGIALAASFDLEVEFDSGQIGTYGVVDIEQNAGDLDFDIALDPSLGDDADLHEVYFNLIGSFTGLAISTTDAPETLYELIADPSTRGGAGADFDYAINFGNGAGKRGNGRLTLVSFTLSADQPLSIADLMETTLASGGSIEISFAAHVQGTSLFRADSETVGGLVPVPQPSSATLLGLGLVGIATGRRRSSGPLARLS